MKREIISTEKAPQAIGPYSQGIVAGDFVFTAGQIPLDPQSGNIVGDDIQTQVRQVLENLKAVLEAAGSGLDRVVKITVYLQDLAHFAKLNEMFLLYFPANPPARSAVQVSRLPKDVLVEIEAIGIREP